MAIASKYLLPKNHEFPSFLNLTQKNPPPSSKIDTSIIHLVFMATLILIYQARTWNLSYFIFHSEINVCVIDKNKQK